ncbi:calcium-binding protein [Hasllibacter halocynthiae]|nr:calcium-binding protein [Hasllibacter halocynthiae]
MFDYRGLGSAAAADLAGLTLALATAPAPGNASEGGDTVRGSWQRVGPEALGLGPEAKDAAGYYIVESPITGAAPGGPQADIWEERDAQGAVIRLAVSFPGTNAPVDIVDYLQLSSGEITGNFEPLLEAVRGYAEANAVAAQDVIVTGFSLGAGYMNLVARGADDLAGGFFADSLFVGHAVPRTFEGGGGRVLNVGFENDVVHRAAGDFDTLLEAVLAAPGLVGQDYALTSSTDNLVLFGDDYASPLWPFGDFALYNILGGWGAHLQMIGTDAVDRIAGSAFYDLTERDSLVIVSNLSDGARGRTWVEDLHRPSDGQGHLGDSAFLVGTAGGDLLRGNVGNDYIDGGAGDDRIRTGNGADRIEGGAGTDTLELRGTMDDWTVAALSDGTLAFVSEAHGLKVASGVEQVTFRDGGFLASDRTFEVEDDRLEDLAFGGWLAWLDRNVAFERATAGGAGSDALSGRLVFGLGGDDRLRAEGDAVLVGGAGADDIRGGAGDDRLYGSEGDDVLIGGGGEDLLNGGLGDDVFVFDLRLGGDVVIEDFNRSDVEADMLRIVGPIDRDDVLDAAEQDAEGVTFTFGTGVLTLRDVTLDELGGDLLVLV